MIFCRLLPMQAGKLQCGRLDNSAGNIELKVPGVVSEAMLISQQSVCQLYGPSKSR